MGSIQLKRVILPKSGVDMFYREQTTTDTANVLVLLHGFPASSHQYRNLIPLLATRYRVIAPDLPGFGFTQAPADFKYSFETLTNTVSEFLDVLNIAKFAVYVFDYGAPVGYRLALQRPDAVQAIISQNGNAYIEGLGDVWAPIKEFWVSDNTPEDRDKIANYMLTYDAVKSQYIDGTPASNTIAPESYTLDYALMERPGNKEIQLDLFLDYRSNVALYDKFHEYFRNSQVPLLAIWGKNDVIFVPGGAEAYKNDLPKAEVKLIDAGHFAIESHATLIGKEILRFLSD